MDKGLSVRAPWVAVFVYLRRTRRMRGAGDGGAEVVSSEVLSLEGPGLRPLRLTVCEPAFSKMVVLVRAASVGGLLTRRMVTVKIGRASCRERVEISVVAVSLTKKAVAVKWRRLQSVMITR